MLQGSVIVIASFVYLGLLFAIAWYGDKRADQGRSIIATPYIYALSMAVYATSWTFYGSVGRAAVSGVGFLPIYLGPTLMAALWWLVLRKMIRIGKTQRITTLADFVASRYGKSALLGGLVTVIAVVGIVPYIALQLKAVSNSFTILIQYPAIVMPTQLGDVPILQDTAFYVALLLAAFTIAFGTRHLDATERHEGLVAAIAFESLVKMLAFLMVGLFVTYGIYNGFGDLFDHVQASAKLSALLTMKDSAVTYGNWISLTILSMFAILFLPRQFQVSVVENVNESHLNKAIWLFPLYLFIINLFVLPITFAGLMMFPDGSVDADTFVLTLPMSQQQEALALLVFIGGLSAATGMVIVETIALSTMVCNDLMMPILLRMKSLRLAERADLSWLLLDIRRYAIVVILLLGYAYFRFAGEAYALVSIGLISFAAVAQFAPALLGGIFWKSGNRAGALAGLSAGFLVWLYTLLLPSFAKSGWLPLEFLNHGLFGLELLKPQELFGLKDLDNITHSLFWSLFANLGCYIGFSLATRQGVVEQAQAVQFVDVFKQQLPGQRIWRGSASVKEVVDLVGRFMGQAKAGQVFHFYALRRGLKSVGEIPADADFVNFAEKQLAGTIGAASAHIMVASVVEEEPLGLEEVMDILDEASQILAYSHKLEQKSRELEAATAELKAANERLQELDRMKDDFISTVTHELRTPLTSIRALSEMLHDDPKIQLDQRTRFLGIILKETERLTRLINQVLDMAKLESGRAQWNSSQVDLREVIEESVTATGQLFKDKGIALEMDLAPVPDITADQDRLIQVMVNLLSNAVKFCRQADGRVQIRLSHSGGELRVAVQDNGEGIRPGDQAIVFERFRQVGDTLTSKPQGTGLGLPISRQIIEHFGGRMWVESEWGRGATFVFTLPLPAKNAKVSASAGGPEQA
jgi:Na+/proline symporter/nitrogen-specific signal transduction histidine kinase